MTENVFSEITDKGKWFKEKFCNTLIKLQELQSMQTTRIEDLNENLDQEIQSKIAEIKVYVDLLKSTIYCKLETLGQLKVQLEQTKERLDQLHSTKEQLEKEKQKVINSCNKVKDATNTLLCFKVLTKTKFMYNNSLTGMFYNKSKDTYVAFRIPNANKDNLYQEIKKSCGENWDYILDM